MKLRWAILVAAAAAPQTSLAEELPNRLRCELTGSGSCAEGGICIGGGVSHSGVRLTVDVKSAQIELNGLKGHISGDEAIRTSDARYVQWRWGLVGLDEIAIRNREDNRFTLTLSGPSGSPVTREAEFTCVRD